MRSGWVRRTCGFAGWGGFGRRLAGDLARRLVLAQAAEGGVAQDAVGGPGAELDLGDELGLDPDDAARRVGGQLLGEGRGLAAERREPRHQVARHLAAEAGADPAGVHELAVLVVAEHQRADDIL